MFRVLFVLLCSFLAAGCATTPKDNEAPSQSAEASPGDAAKKLLDSAERLRSLKHTFTDDQLQALFSEAKDQAEQKFSVDLDEVSLSLVDRFRYQNVLSSQLKQSAHLFPKTARLPWQLGDATQAIYDLESQSVFLHPNITRRYPFIVGTSRELATEYLRFVLLHELVHAVDHSKQRLKLNWPTIRLMTNTAVVREGHAHYWASIMCEEQGCENYINKIRTIRSRQSTRFAPPNDTMVMYETGERFVKHLAAKDSSGDLLERAFLNPPTDEYQILFPDLYPDSTRDESNQRVLDVIRSVELPWQGDFPAEMVMNTVDKFAMRNAANDRLRPAYRKLANSVRGDGMVGYFPNAPGQTGNVVLRVIEASRQQYAEQSYKTMVSRHRKQSDVQKFYQLKLPDWVFERDSKELGIGGNKMSVDFINGRSHSTGTASDSKTTARIQVMVMRGERYIVRIENFTNDIYDLTGVGEQVMRKLAG